MAMDLLLTCLNKEIGPLSTLQKLKFGFLALVSLKWGVNFKEILRNLTSFLCKFRVTLLPSFSVDFLTCLGDVWNSKGIDHVYHDP